MKDLTKLIIRITVVTGLLLLFFFLFLFLIVLLDWLLPVGYQHIPVYIGIPAAAILSFIVIIVTGIAIDYSSKKVDQVEINPEISSQQDSPENKKKDFYNKPSERIVYTDSYNLKSRRFYYLVLIWLLCFAVFIISIYILWPLTTDRAGKKEGDGKIDITFLQINDVYEISPLDHGKIGGMARVATYRKELEKENKNTYTLLAGDFLSPSAIGTLKYDTSKKEKIAGMHMLETLNAVGVDLATFGNHEFDIKPQELNDAINRSTFDWVSSNVQYHDNGALKKFRKNGSAEIPHIKIIHFDDEDGTEVKIGVFGLTIKTPTNTFEAYDDYFASAENAINELEGKCDFIVALTHLDIDTDKELARRYPEIKLIIGGHEHINSYDTVGTTIIAKADANAKTVYVHYLNYNTDTKRLKIESRLTVINNSIKEDVATRDVIYKWNNTAHSLLVQQGFEPCEIIDSLDEPLDGTEASIRTKETNLGKLIGDAMIEAVDGVTVDCSIFNSGSIRIDDMLTGYITQYDIFRVVPYGGAIAIRILNGSTIDSLLRANNDRKKDGSFLQYSGITRDKDSFLIQGKKIILTNPYTVVMSKYLAEGSQPGLDYIGKIKPDFTLPRLKKEIPKNDLQKILIEKIKKKHVTPKVWPKNNLKVPCY